MIGKYVEIIGGPKHEVGGTGVVTGLRSGDEWWVKLSTGTYSGEQLSYTAAHLKITDAEYTLAVRVLGEGYFD